MMPLVSIVIPCYNHDSYVQDCILSVVEQDYENIELIIIDDGSMDDSSSRIRELIPICEKRFSRFEFRHRNNRGLCATLNEGIEWSKGKYFSAIASDDLMLPEKTSKQVVFLEKNGECSGVFGGMEIVDKNSSTIKYIHGTSKIYGFEEIFLRDSFLPAPTQMLNMSEIHRVGFYDEGCKVEDFYMWLKITNNGHYFYCLPDVVVRYRRHVLNISLNHEKIWDDAEKILLRYSEHKLYSIARAKSALVNAFDVQTSSKSASFFWFFRAVKLNLKVVFTNSFLRYLVKFFLPYSFIRRN